MSPVPAHTQQPHGWRRPTGHRRWGTVPSPRKIPAGWCRSRDVMKEAPGRHPRPSALSADGNPPPLLRARVVPAHGGLAAGNAHAGAPFPAGPSRQQKASPRAPSRSSVPAPVPQELQQGPNSWGRESHARRVLPRHTRVLRSACCGHCQSRKRKAREKTRSPPCQSAGTTRPPRGSPGGSPGP